jgi:hypothetical protein
MASRKAQKEAARQARLEAEREVAARAARTQRLRLGGGALLAVAAVVAVAVAIAAGGSSGPGAASGKAVKTALAKLPADAAAAGCVLKDTPTSIGDTSDNRLHVPDGTKIPYASNPPSYGPHYAVPAHDQSYVGQTVPPIGNLVHSLEHGRVEYQYRPGLPQAQIAQLTALYNESAPPFKSQQYVLLFQNPTAMPYDVAATAWDHLLGCRTFSQKTLPALRDFRIAYSFKAPETGFTGPE